MKKSIYQTQSRTTVVPIINVSLVVVLTLMVIAPFLNDSEHPIELPHARAAEVDDTDNVEITYTLSGEIWIGQDQVALGDVTHYLGIMFRDLPHAVAVVKADRNLRYGEVEQLIAAIEAADAPRVALATKDRNREGRP